MLLKLSLNFLWLLCLYTNSNQIVNTYGSNALFVRQTILLNIMQSDVVDKYGNFDILINS